MNQPAADEPQLNLISREQTSLGELAKVFLRLGTTAFGGPAAHIAMMEEEIVRRRKWMERQQFLDLLGATNLIPGPNSTELAIHIGYERAGWRGLIVAGICFILPAFLIVTMLAWVYVHYGKMPQVTGVFYGVKPVVIAIVAQALWTLGQTALKTRLLLILSGGVLILSFAGVNELGLLFGAGILTALIQWLKKFDSRSQTSVRMWLPVVPLFWQTEAIAATAANTFSLWALFLFFLKVGSVLFGSGYVLLAFLRGDLVERWGWLTDQQLLDAIAVGQITPGPVFTTATFIGFLLAGTSGAIAATIGIFLPAFVFVAASGWLVPRLRRSAIMAAFLDGVNAASLALMALVTLQLGKSALIDVLTILLAIVSFALLIRLKINSIWLIAGGALIGLIRAAI